MSALYHQIEMNRFNAAEGYLLARKLKEALLQRRDVKREQERLAVVYPMIRSLLEHHSEATGKLIKCEAKQAEFIQPGLVANAQ